MSVTRTVVLVVAVAAMAACGGAAASATGPRANGNILSGHWCAHSYTTGAGSAMTLVQSGATVSGTSVNTYYSYPADTVAVAGSVAAGTVTLTIGGFSRKNAGLWGSAPETLTGPEPGTGNTAAGSLDLTASDGAAAEWYFGTNTPSDVCHGWYVG